MIGVYYLHLFIDNTFVGWLAGFLETMPGRQFWALHAGLATAGVLLACRFAFGKLLAPEDVAVGESPNRELPRPGSRPPPSYRRVGTGDACRRPTMPGRLELFGVALAGGFTLGQPPGQPSLYLVAYLAYRGDWVGRESWSSSSGRTARVGA